MLSRIKTIPYRIYLSKYLFSDDSYNRFLTKAIISARTGYQLKQIINKNGGNFNLFNISALLKKMNANIKYSDQLMNLTYEQVKQCLAQIEEPNPFNARALSNIIGYTGNLLYQGIDTELTKIDYKKLFKFVNEKQFVLTLTGLLKLNLIDKISLTKQQMDQIITDYLHKNKSFGLFISLWRNFIKSGKSNRELNIKFGNKIVDCEITSNFKDFGYLIYCYIQVFEQIAADGAEGQKLSRCLMNTIKLCSENILISTRIDVFQLCVFSDSLAKLKKIANLQISESFLQMFSNHYVRIVSENLGLRSLANGYDSLMRLCQKVNLQVYNITAKRYVQLCGQKKQNTQDYESYISLFVELIQSRPISTQNEQVLLNPQKLYPINMILENVMTLMCNNRRIYKLSDKQFQKFLYGLYRFKTKETKIDLSNQQIEHILGSTFRRSHLSKQQINSIITFFGELQIKGNRVCVHFRQLVKQCWEKEKQTENTIEMKKQSKQEINFKKVLTRPCVLGLSKQKCMNCISQILSQSRKVQ